MALKLNVSKEHFLSALALLQNISGKKGTLPILANVLIQCADNTIELIATDLEVGIKNMVPAEIVQPGAITLPAKILYEIVKESGTEKISLEEQDNYWMKIVAGSSVYNLAGTAAEEYPAFPEYNDGDMVSFACDSINELIEKTVFSVANERESNFTLTGILLERDELKDGSPSLRMVSSDGHRLSIMERRAQEEIKNISFEKNIIIPRRGVLEIRKICEANETVRVGFDKKQIVLKSEKVLIIIRLLNGDFPDYRNIIKVIVMEKSIEVERVLFLEALKRTNLFTEDNFNAVQLDVNKESIVLSSHNADYGNATDKIGTKYDGEPLTIGFNCRYFIETLQVMKSDIIKLYINSEQSPCLIQGDDDPGFMSIIMPMKI
ncbi:MAG: DNA polymerase III subunit beta [Desulfobacterales bacterium]|nr:DNA polymerase III subunit beta [Desulfobacterales bacterium]